MRAHPRRIAHLTTVDLSLRYLLLPQLTAPLDVGVDSYGISAPGPWVDELEELGIVHEPLNSSTRGVDFRSDLKAAIESGSAPLLALEEAAFDA